MITQAIEKLTMGEDLDFDLTKDIFDRMLEGAFSDDQIATFLVKLADKKETSTEIAAAATSLIDHAVMENVGFDSLDTCGTGGDGKNTFNISTAAAIITSLFIPTIKHGNRAVSSRSGSADLLENLRVPIDLKKDDALEYLKMHNFVFLFAPNYHPAMKRVAGVRKKLARRTIFNLLGPLVNPFNVNSQLIGVFDRRFLGVLFDAAAQMGKNRVGFVSSFDGLDEVSIASKTQCYIRRDGIDEVFVFDPLDLNIHGSFEDMRGFDANTNASMLEGVLMGEYPRLADAIALNSGFSMYVAGIVDSIEDGYRLSIESIKNGSAKDKLDELRENYGNT